MGFSTWARGLGLLIHRGSVLAGLLLAAACSAPAPESAESGSAESTPAVGPVAYRGADVLEAGGEAAVKLIASQQIDDTGQRHLTYNGAFPGPEIRVAPGETFDVLLYNALEHLTVEDLENFNPPVVRDNDDAEVKAFIASQSAVTNLHTHGFHVSPRGRSDNVLLRIDRQRHNAYRYELPRQHAPGTHWYHAHLHGSTALQVQGGMAGALIVTAPPRQSLNPPGYSVLERVLVLQFGDGGGLDPESKRRAGGGAEAARSVSNTDPGQGRAGVESEEEVLAGLPALRVNGLENPTARLQQDVEVQRLRIVNAGSRRRDYKSLWIEGHPMYLAAFDGVNLTDLPKGADGTFIAYDEDNPLVLAPGNRADVYFLPTESGAFALMMEGEVGLRDPASTESLATREAPRRKFVRRLMTFDVSGPDLSSEASEAAGLGVDLDRFLEDLNVNLVRLQATEPYSAGYLRSFTAAPKIRREVTFSIENSGTPQRSFRINDRDYNEVVNGEMRGHFDYLGKVKGDGGRGPAGQAPWPLRAGTEEEWKISNVSTVRHPFHVHVSPFWVVDIEEDNGAGEIVSVRATNPDDPRLDRWQDTVDLPPNGGSVTVRHRVSDYVGLYVIHCHILQHEDRGMMINVLTVPNGETDPEAYFDAMQEENRRINEEINGEAQAH